MNVFTPQAPALGFKGQTSWLKGLAPDIAGSLITAAADIALVLDNDGTIRDVALASDDLRREGFEDWVGKRFCDVVTVESRPKVQDLLDSAGHSATVHFREINHPSAGGPDAPVRYSAVRISSEGPVIALGRDLRLALARRAGVVCRALSDGELQLGDRAELEATIGCPSAGARVDRPETPPRRTRSP